MEVWKLIAEAPDYEVSNLGRIRKIPTQQIMRHGISNGTEGYPQVSLQVSGRKLTRKVHIFVAMAFLGPRPDGAVINHINYDKSDPRAENLEYVTRSENGKHAYRFQSRVDACPRGSRHKNSVLTEEIVRTIRLRKAKGDSQLRLAREFKVSQANISSICNRRTWKHVP